MASESRVESLFSWQDASGNTSTLDVDVVMTANDTREAKLTDHVVETGAVITDHVVIQPESLSLDLVVTQTPMTAGNGFTMTSGEISAPGQKLKAQTHPIKVQPSAFQPGGFLLLSTGLRGAISSLLGAAGGNSDQMSGSKVETTASSLRVSTLQSASAVDRVGDVHDRLVEIMNGALLVTVSFKGRLYIDYLLTKVELLQQAGKAGMGTFKVTARAFRTVTGTTVSLPDPADFRALPKVNKGNKPSAVGPIHGPPPPPVSDLAKATDRVNTGIDQWKKAFWP
jgi:hypothetical protein